MASPRPASAFNHSSCMLENALACIKLSFKESPRPSDISEGAPADQVAPESLEVLLVEEVAHGQAELPALGGLIARLEIGGGERWDVAGEDPRSPGEAFDPTHMERCSELLAAKGQAAAG